MSTYYFHIWGLAFKKEMHLQILTTNSLLNQHMTRQAEIKPLAKLKQLEYFLIVDFVKQIRGWAFIEIWAFIRINMVCR